MSNPSLLTIPLQALTPVSFIAQPVTVGIPFPKGLLQDPGALILQSSSDGAIPLQTEALAHWPDQSIQWLLLDLILRDLPKGSHTLILSEGASNREVPPTQHPWHPWVESLKGASTRSMKVSLQLTTHRGEETIYLKEEQESTGSIRQTLALNGKSQRCSGLVVLAWFSIYPDCQMASLRCTLRNENAAQHKGGLWDLGDPASVQIHHWALSCSTEEPFTDASIQMMPEEPFRKEALPWLLEQNSTASRPLPTVSVSTESGVLNAAIVDFWQRYPKAIEISNNELSLALLTGAEELQPGEQTTSTLWLQQSAQPQSLEWCHSPAVIHANPEWYQQCGLIPKLSDAASRKQQLEELLNAAIEGENSFVAKREVIDEYGWRNYGDIWADHEQEFYKGEKPVLSHYNNQYDVIWGAMLQFFRTGNPQWQQIFAPLAQHVIDIDIYHTIEDKAAYNGGLFWHTDHYHGAATATHRCYSKANAPNGQPYGGGPSNEHNYTTGLLHWYYLTGDPLAREAVLSLANWVLQMDNGSNTIFGVIDSGPTGLASATREDSYHGPGRGAGNSIHVLVDAWLLTQERHYQDYAEALIRRCIHPKDDISKRDLLNLEDRWSYPVFLIALSRYLDLKADQGAIDKMYAYAQAALLHYAEWMAEHERHYFDHTDRMQYVTVTWAAQEIRKANVLRLAARHALEPLRSRLIERGEVFAERTWKDILSFESRTTTRPLAILLVEGLRDVALQVPVDPAPRPTETYDFGEPQEFLPQKQRVKAQLKSPGGIARTMASLLSPRAWLRYWRRNSQ